MNGSDFDFIRLHENKQSEPSSKKGENDINQNENEMYETFLRCKGLCETERSVEKSTWAAEAAVLPENISCSAALAETLWLDSFGRTSVWSEYTLYRLILDRYGLFDYFHIPQVYGLLSY